MTGPTLLQYLKNSPTPYHAVIEARKMLDAAGFSYLDERDEWKIEAGHGYYTVRGGSSLIAFRMPKGEPRAFLIGAAHSDSPTLRVKAAEDGGYYTRLTTEKYGGAILYTFFDRPLSVAGIVCADTGDGIETIPVCVDRDLCVLPSLAIHFDRSVNDGRAFDMKTDMLPLLGKSGTGEDFLRTVAEAAGVEPEQILSHDLRLYVRQDPCTVGVNSEYVLSPRLDDLSGAYALLRAMGEAQPEENAAVYALFDHEEVGSNTRTGADSGFLGEVLRRIGGERTERMIAGGMCVSADNAHAIHPAHPEVADKDNAPKMNEGVVIKINAAAKYATDAKSQAIFTKLCKNADVKTQLYYNRADLPGGSTVGSILAAQIGIATVDVGLPQLAMHSAVETMGVSDVEELTHAMRAFYSCPMHITDGTVTF